MAYKWFDHISESVKGKHDYQLQEELEKELSAAGVVSFSVCFERKRGRAHVFFGREEVPGMDVELVKKIFLASHPAWRFESADVNPSLGCVPVEFRDTTI